MIVGGAEETVIKKKALTVSTAVIIQFFPFMMVSVGLNSVWGQLHSCPLPDLAHVRWYNDNDIGNTQNWLSLPHGPGTMLYVLYIIYK